MERGSNWGVGTMVKIKDFTLVSKGLRTRVPLWALCADAHALKEAKEAGKAC